MKLQDKIKRLTEQSGIGLEESFSADLCSIMEENNSDVTRNFAEGSFSRLFWCQQLQAAKVTNSKQMRWHPCMIRWCLNLKSLSSSAYHSLRTSGFMKLPSERTLRDYTHFIKSKVGFYSDLDQQLADEAQLRSWLLLQTEHHLTGSFFVYTVTNPAPTHHIPLCIKPKTLTPMSPGLSTSCPMFHIY